VCAFGLNPGSRPMHTKGVAGHWGYVAGGGTGRQSWLQIGRRVL